jgi:hypothetical protein
MQSAQTSMAGVDPHTTQMNQFRSYVTMLGDPSCKDVLKLKATQEISKNFEVKPPRTTKISTQPLANFR